MVLLFSCETLFLPYTVLPESPPAELEHLSSAGKNCNPSMSPGGALLFGTNTPSLLTLRESFQSITMLWERAGNISGPNRSLIHLQQPFTFNVAKHSNALTAFKDSSKYWSNSPVPAVFKRTITPEGQNTFKQPGKCCRTQRIMVKITNFIEFQKNWSLPVVVPGFCLVSCCVSPLMAFYCGTDS